MNRKNDGVFALKSLRIIWLFVSFFQLYLPVRLKQSNFHPSGSLDNWYGQLLMYFSFLLVILSFALPRYARKTAIEQNEGTFIATSIVGFAFSFAISSFGLILLCAKDTQSEGLSLTILGIVTLLLNYPRKSQVIDFLGENSFKEEIS